MSFMGELSSTPLTDYYGNTLSYLFFLYYLKFANTFLDFHIRMILGSCKRTINTCTWLVCLRLTVVCTGQAYFRLGVGCTGKACKLGLGSD